MTDPTKPTNPTNPTTHPTNFTTFASGGGEHRPYLALTKCDTRNGARFGAIEEELELRLSALANTAATLGMDGMNYAINRANQINRDLGRIQRGIELQAKPPAGYCAVAECVAMLAVSERTVRRWMAEGDLVPVRLKGRVFIELEKARKLKGITSP